MANTKMLKTLLPNKLPIAISNAPILKAEIEMTSSGKEVVMARNKVAKGVAQKSSGIRRYQRVRRRSD